VGAFAAGRARARKRLARVDRIGNRTLHGLSIVVALLTVAMLVEVGHQMVGNATHAMSRFGLGFLTDSNWELPPFDRYGAAPVIFGTAVSSALALVVAAPIGISIGLYLAIFAPGRLRGVVGPLIETLAAVPSVILGLWGVLVLAPFVSKRLEPFLHSTLGFLPIFGPAQPTGLSLFTGALVLAIMVVPIIASLSRDLFRTVPRDLTDGAAALGATQWEVIRGVILPTTAAGVAAAVVLGLGRALGEAIAILQVSGGGAGARIHGSLFLPGDTLAARIANDASSIVSPLEQSSLFYLGTILLVIAVVTNLIAQWIGRRFAYQPAGAP
jgi:phosphate transport system permease protein